MRTYADVIFHCFRIDALNQTVCSESRPAQMSLVTKAGNGRFKHLNQMMRFRTHPSIDDKMSCTKNASRDAFCNRYYQESIRMMKKPYAANLMPNPVSLDRIVQRTCTVHRLLNGW